MSFVSLSGKYHCDKKSPCIGAEDLGDRHWKTAFSDSGWRYLTMDQASRQHGSCMGVAAQSPCSDAFLVRFAPNVKIRSFAIQIFLCLVEGKLGMAVPPLLPFSSTCSGWCGTRAWRHPAPAQPPRHFSTNLTESPTFSRWD